MCTPSQDCYLSSLNQNNHLSNHPSPPGGGAVFPSWLLTGFATLDKLFRNKLGFSGTTGGVDFVTNAPEQILQAAKSRLPLLPRGGSQL